MREMRSLAWATFPAPKYYPRSSPKADTWRARATKGKLYRFCANADFGVCNWMVDADSADRYCVRVPA